MLTINETAKRRGTLRKEVCLSYIRLRRVILLRSDIRLHRVSQTNIISLQTWFAISLSERKILLQALAWNSTSFVFKISEHRILAPEIQMNLYSDGINKHREHR